MTQTDDRNTTHDALVAALQAAWKSCGEAHDALVAALQAAWKSCGEAHEVRPGVFAGDNLAERLSAALSQLAGELGGVEHLVKHRPGCWEAEHVRALAGPDWMRDD